MLVAAEFKHPGAEPIGVAEQSALKRHLMDRLPLTKPFTAAQIYAEAPPGGPPQVKQVRQVTFPRFMSRDRRTSVVFGDESLVVETTSYTHFEDFMDLIVLAANARQKIAPVDGIERAGLRYIDEIRIPGHPEGWGDEGWAEWVNPMLLGAAGLETDGLHALRWQGQTSFRYGGEDSRHEVVLRHGPNEGYAVPPGQDLRRPVPPPGPYFLIDVDSFWLPADDEVPEFDAGRLAELLPTLHAPVRSLFEGSITDKLRKVFRNAD